MKIYQILKEHNARGKENAMTTERLMELSGLTQREIVAQVKEERKHHFIGSTTQRDGGYYRLLISGKSRTTADSGNSVSNWPP